MRKSLLLFFSATLCAQDPLSLRDAVRLALRENKAIAASAAGVRASAERKTQARSGMLPKVNFAESFARSNNPVFVFSSLLTQHQFGAGNFNIGPLNRPDALNNFQTQVTVDQSLYDGGQTRGAVRSADLGEKMSAEEQRRVQMEVVAGVARAYHNSVLAAESLKAAEQAVGSAEADLKRAEAVRAVGMSTDVDVLSLRVHLAAVSEQRISRGADLDIAKAALNDAMGLPLDTPHSLTTALSPIDLPGLTVGGLETQAGDSRPEARQSRLASSMAQVQAKAARDLRLPQVGFRAIFETDAQRFVTRGGANWLAAVSLRWNLFNGFSDKSKASETAHDLERAKAGEQRVGSAVRLQVRQAYAGLRAAQQRIEIAKAAVALAEESLRITQNRYEAGLANVTDLLRNETALLESRTRHLTAVHDQRLTATMLEYAAGTLSADSEVLN